jgi:eukaryotic translation initiation factor 2C
VDLKDVTKTLLRKYQSKNGNVLPTHILVYRDGVSKGQFDHVMAHEVTSMKQAFPEIGPTYQPILTFITVQKRHHTRFYPENRDDATRSGNVPPGTTVDTVIVDPFLFDFFICSHNALQGTARPAHYCVLYDKYGFGADELQEITYFLTYIYSRCTKPISLPTPVMYAHLAAEKAKKHLVAAFGEDASDRSSVTSAGTVQVEVGDGTLTKRQIQVLQELSQAVSVDEALKDRLYFV